MSTGPQRKRSTGKTSKEIRDNLEGTNVSMVKVGVGREKRKAFQKKANAKQHMRKGTGSR